ncbi:hypothetical protein RB195_019615 [Necator americanus]|uniref:Uncharacterized protein n=1 Tax=Necator americanus TaxID=51031 RepID=A0ABR1CHJ7_NECAM
MGDKWDPDGRRNHVVRLDKAEACPTIREAVLAQKIQANAPNAELLTKDRRSTTDPAKPKNLEEVGSTTDNLGRNMVEKRDEHLLGTGITAKH